MGIEFIARMIVGVDKEFLKAPEFNKFVEFIEEDEEMIENMGDIQGYDYNEYEKSYQIYGIEITESEKDKGSYSIIDLDRLEKEVDEKKKEFVSICRKHAIDCIDVCHLSLFSVLSCSY